MENSAAKQKTTKVQCKVETNNGRCLIMVNPSKKYCRKHRYEYIEIPKVEIWKYIDHYRKNVLECGRVGDGSSVDLCHRIGKDGSITRPSDKIFCPPPGYYHI